MAPARVPAFFAVLAWFGIVLGSFGSVYAVAQGMSFLRSRDSFIAEHRSGAAERMASRPPADPERVHQVQMAEKLAETLYARRNAILPLAALDFLLSLMLFSGCARALRGVPQGIATWRLAAVMSVFYTVIDAVLAILKTQDLHAALLALKEPLLATGAKIQGILWLFVAGVELAYYLVCVFYLRRVQPREA